MIFFFFKVTIMSQTSPWNHYHACLIFTCHTPIWIKDQHSLQQISSTSSNIRKSSSKVLPWVLRKLPDISSCILTSQETKTGVIRWTYELFKDKCTKGQSKTNKKVVKWNRSGDASLSHNWSRKGERREFLIPNHISLPHCCPWDIIITRDKFKKFKTPLVWFFFIKGSTK